MPDNGLAALESELRAKAPAGVRALEDESLRDLAQAIADARHRQAAQLQKAGDQALRYIPRVLRVPIRRMFR